MIVYFGEKLSYKSAFQVSEQIGEYSYRKKELNPPIYFLDVPIWTSSSLKEDEPVY